VVNIQYTTSNQMLPHRKHYQQEFKTVENVNSRISVSLEVIIADLNIEFH